MLDAISNLVATAILIAAIYGLVFWANKARTDRSAIVGIYLFFGLPGGLLTLAGIALVINTDLGEGPFILASGISFLLPLIKPIRKLVARFTPMDPESPIDLCGLALIIWITSFFIISAVQSGPVEVDGDGGGALLENSVWLLLNALTFVAIAYVSVGYRIYRSGIEATKRLGLEWPDLRTVLISLGMVIPCYLVAIMGNVLTLIFQPDVLDNLQETMDDMTTGLDNPIGMILIGLSAGIGEEVLFRGAVQPRFGIVIAALFWTSMHAQYDVSFVLVGLFGVGVILGLQRKYFGTASAIITHAVYNMIAVAITIANGHILWF
jgi:membrane protease YdiL (CAAX protease family)